jgi:TRAP-type transport system periplasmic protein
MIIHRYTSAFFLVVLTVFVAIAITRLPSSPASVVVEQSAEARQALAEQGARPEQSLPEQQGAAMYHRLSEQAAATDPAGAGEHAGRNHPASTPYEPPEQAAATPATVVAQVEAPLPALADRDVVAQHALALMDAAPDRTAFSRGARPKQKESHRFKLATLAPIGSSLEKILQQMGQEWRQAPDGGVHLTIYAGGVQGGEADTVRKLRQGSLDAALLTVVGLSEIHDSVEALQNMPMMFHSLEEVDYIGGKLRPRIEKNLRDKGYVVLFWADLGWVRFFSKEPVLTPADLKKAKLFSWAGSIDEADILKAAGFTPVPLETADILPSLNTGLINAVALPPYYAAAMQVHRTAPNMLEINWAPLVGGLVVRERSWNKLSPETQRELARAAWQAGERMRAQNRAESDRAVQAMASSGLKVHKLTPAQEAEWRQAANAAYPRIRGRIVPAELFDEVQKHLVQYRSAHRGVPESRR